MPLHPALLKQWHAAHRVAERCLTLTDEGVVLGKTVLAPFRRGRLAIDGRRIVALLSVAYGKEIPAAVIKPIRAAECCWKNGDKTLALMRLALCGLPAVDLEKAQRLFVSDWALSRGMTQQQLRKIADMLQKDEDDDSEDDGSDDEGDGGGSSDGSDSSDASDFDSEHPRWPAGSPGGIGGEFAPKDASDATTTLHDAITQDAQSAAPLNSNAVWNALTSGIDTPSSLPQGTNVAGGNVGVSEQNDASSEVQVAIDIRASIATAIVNLLNGSTPDPDHPIVGGVVPQLNRVGDWNTANNDFNSMGFVSVEDKGGGVRVGTMPDGYSATIRPLSVPTIDIRDSSNTLLYKIRYKQ
jgi:hypothetical protein